MSRRTILEPLMQEEEQLIKDRNFYLSMIDSCNDIIRHSSEVGYTKITEQFKVEKEEYHQKWIAANTRLKEIDKAIGGLD